MRKAHEVFWRKEVEPNRLPPPYGGDKSWGTTGGFKFGDLRVICSDGEGWDHVSVSRADRIPTWEEMCHIRDLFFGPDEVVMQLHPRHDDYVNNHSRCLHLWKPQTDLIPMPPAWMVGTKSLGVLT